MHALLNSKHIPENYFALQNCCRVVDLSWQLLLLFMRDVNKNKRWVQQYMPEAGTGFRIFECSLDGCETAVPIPDSTIAIFTGALRQTATECTCDACMKSSINQDTPALFL